MDHIIQRILRMAFLLFMCFLLIPAGGFTESGSKDAAAAMLRNGGSFLIIVREDGSLVGWGDNRRGQMGTENTKVHTHPIAIADGINGKELRDIQCGNNNTLFLMKNGDVYTCGTYACGTQGLGPINKNVRKPVKIPSLSRIVQISCGFGHNAALDEEGRLWVWGRNDHGQLGTGNRRNADTPVRLDLENIAAVNCGGKFTLAQDREGNFFGWGSNAYRVLENSTRQMLLTPEKLEGLDGHRFVAFSGGSDMAFWLDDEGGLWSRGRNELKQCGSSKAAWKVSPELTRVEIPEKVKTIVAYSSVPVALTENGNAYIWGCTTNGQIGNGTAPGSSLPEAGWNTGDCMQVAAGSIFTSLMTTDGKIYVSGYNSYGQLGNGTTRETSFWTWNGTCTAQTGEPQEEARRALLKETP